MKHRPDLAEYVRTCSEDPIVATSGSVRCHNFIERSADVDAVRFTSALAFLTNANQCFQAVRNGPINQVPSAVT